MNSLLSKVIAIMTALFLLTYVIYQSVQTFYEPYSAEYVTYGDYVDSVDFDGFFVRSENTLDIAKSGAVNYNYKNAQKISNNDEIATIYSSESDLYNLKLIEFLEKEKSILIEAEKGADVSEGMKLDLLNTQAALYRSEIVKAVDDKKLADIDDSYYKLMLTMNKSKLCVDKTVDLTASVANIDQKITELKSKLPSEVESIESENSGYFSSVTDGLEETTSFGALTSESDIFNRYTVSKTAAFIEEKPVSDTGKIGKLVNENYWYFVSLVSVKKLDGLEKAQKAEAPILLKFNSKSTREIPAVVKKISKEEDKDKAVVIFKSDYMDEDLINMRFETPQAVIGSYSGVIIPKEAIRLVDNPEDINEDGMTGRVKGVYTIFGKETKFKLVDIIYEDDYVIVSRLNAKTSYVSSYDKVVIKGKNLS